MHWWFFVVVVYESTCRIEKSELAQEPPCKLMHMRTALLCISCKIVFGGSGHVSIASPARAEVCECEPRGLEGCSKAKLWLLWYRWTLQHLAGHGRADEVCCQRETLGELPNPFYPCWCNWRWHKYLPTAKIAHSVRSLCCVVLPSHELLRNAVFMLLPETSGDYNLINFQGKPRELLALA